VYLYNVVCVADVLAADKQLANEVEFDLRKFEEQEKQQQKEQQKSCNAAVSCCLLHIVTLCSYYLLSRARMHNTVITATSKLKSIYDGVVFTSVCMTPS